MQFIYDRKRKLGIYHTATEFFKKIVSSSQEKKIFRYLTTTLC